MEERAVNQGILAAKKDKKTHSLRGLVREYNPSHTSISAQWNPFWTSDFHTCKIIKLCCLKLLSLWLICHSSHPELYSHNPLLTVSLLTSVRPPLSAAFPGKPDPHDSKRLLQLQTSHPLSFRSNGGFFLANLHGLPTLCLYWDVRGRMWLKEL